MYTATHTRFTGCFTQGRGLPSPGGHAQLGSNNSGMSTSISASLSTTRDRTLARHATAGITTSTAPTALHTAMCTATRIRFTRRFTQGRGLPSPGGHAQLGSNNSGMSTGSSASLRNHTIRANITRDRTLA